PFHGDLGRRAVRRLRMTGGKHGRAGFTLIEAVGVMSGLGIAIGLLTAALGGGTRLGRVRAAALRALSSGWGLPVQFRADVAQAEEAPPRWKDHSAGPTCLLLRLGPDQIVLYCWQAQRLTRSEFVGETVRQQAMSLGRVPIAVEFRRSSPGDRLLTLRLA